MCVLTGERYVLLWQFKCTVKVRVVESWPVYLHTNLYTTAVQEQEDAPFYNVSHSHTYIIK